MKNGMKLVLASKSPRRRIILQEKGYNFDVDVSNFDENRIKDKSIEKRVMKIATGKAKAVASRHKNSLILGVDTLVYFEGKPLGQVKTTAEAMKVLKMLSGKTHEVYSGICLLNTKTGKCACDYDVTKVKLKKMDEKMLKSYIQAGHYIGKAGAYNISDPEFESFVDEVKGSYYNILGLPIEKLQQMLMEAV